MMLQALKRFVGAVGVSCVAVLGLTAAGGCGSTTRGQMEWAQPVTDASAAPRVGRVYLMRGWVGVFSSGIDEMGEKLRAQGVTAHVYQHDQAVELAATIAANYKNVPDPEPICIVGHSYGSDDAIVIARECSKVGVPVELIIGLDCVDETIVPKNVKTCYNFWQSGILPGTNFLRGLPLEQEPGSTGVLHNVNLKAPENAHLAETFTNHVNLDKGPKLQAEIIKQVLAVCPERNTWLASHPFARARMAAAAAPMMGGVQKASVMPVSTPSTPANSAKVSSPSRPQADSGTGARQSGAMLTPAAPTSAVARVRMDGN